jgi:tetratricopeptide (TPR) repeat protein
MLAKTVRFTLVVCAFLILQLTCLSFADAPAQLEQAETLLKKGQYQDAEAIYQQVIAEYPGTDGAFAAQKQLAFLYIAWNRYPLAEAAYNQLLANFLGHKDIPQALHDIAYRYRCVNKHQKANELDQYVVATWPDSDHAVLGQMDIAKYYVDQGDEPNAEAGTAKLLTNYSGHALIARAIHDIAQHYRYTQRYKKANELYQFVVETWPKAEHALWAQADLIKSYVAQGDDTAGEAAVETFLTNFNDNPLIARAVWDTGQYYRDLKKYEKANRLYKHVVEHWPKAEHALWAQADLIKSYLALGDDSSAEAAVEKLIADFSWSTYIARAIHDTAWEYRKLANYGRANELDQYVIDRWPKDVQAMWAKMDMAKTDIALGNYATADKTVDILIANFSDQPELSTAIFMLGEQYYNKAFSCQNQSQTAEAKSHFQKAIAIWERIATEVSEPHSTIAGQAYYFSAYCWTRLGQYENAIQYYQTVVDTWPDYEYAWHAQFRIGNCYRMLAQSGAMAESEANTKMAYAYWSGVEKYPDSPSARYTLLILRQLDFKKRRRNELAAYVESLRQKHGLDARWSNVLNSLGRTCEKVGELERALEGYAPFFDMPNSGEPGIESLKAKPQELGGLKK